MKEPLHKWYKRVIPLLFLFCLFGNRLIASPDCPIIAANFSGLSDGTTVNNGTTGWYINAGSVASGAIFWVKSNRFHAQELGGEGVWYSKVFSVAGYTDFQIATKITAEGDMNSTEYVKVYYKINGGAEILLDQRTGNFGTIDFVSPLLNGNNVQFVIRIYNYNNGGSQTSKYYIEDYRVFKEHGPCAGGIPVSVSAGNNGVLTCTNASLTLNASSSASGVTYSWTGLGGFTSTVSNPVITVAGTYNVNATSSAGSGSASITITENKAAPGVTATGASLGCVSSVTINATSPVANAQYAWTGPGSFSSTQQNPVVATAGTYTVTVTNPANGCTSTQQVQVTAGTATAAAFWLEDFTFANGTTTDTGTTPWTIENAGSGTFSVQNNEFMASFSAANEGIWRSGVINIASKNNVVVSVNLKSGTGGSSDYLEDDDYIRVYYKLNGGPETLIFGDIAGLNGINNGTATATATSTALNGNTLEIVIRARNSHSTERYYFDNVTLTGYNSGAEPLSASVSGIATCTSAAQLSATATRAVSSWSWTGPGGFTSTQQNPIVSVGGQYIVTATFTDGCTASLPVTVTEDKTAPGVTASGGSLACFASIQINASSSLATVQYSWSGPNSFTSTVRNPAVTAAGTYTVTATNPANGCTSSQSVQVTPAYGVVTNLWTEDFTLSNGTTSDNGATGWTVQTPSGAVAAVNSNQFRVSNTGTAGEAVWTSGSINIAGKSNVSITAGVRSSITGSAVMNETGEYADYIRLYYKLNNGAEVLFHEKKADVNSHSTTLTPVSVSALNGDSLRIVVRARATGNDEFYYFDNMLVTGESGAGIDASASVSDTLTCTTSSVTLLGNSTVPGVTYSWTGPGGFTALTQNASVTEPGVYTLTVTSGSCTGIATVTVVREYLPPANLTITKTTSTDTLTCNVNHVIIVASSSTPGTQYTWTGPNGYTANGPGITVFNPGVYSVIALHPTSGCTDTATYTVHVNRIFPGASTTPNLALLTCTNPSIEITAGATATAVKYSWTGPEGLTATGPAVTATAPGNYYLLVTDTINGCTTSTTAVMVEGRTVPSGLTISVPSDASAITCINSEVPLTGNAASGNVNYSWTGPGGFQAATSAINATVEGVYTMTATHTSSGCTATRSYTVVRDMESPADVLITPVPANAQITCLVPDVILTGSSATPGVTYSWSGPSFTSSVANPAVNTAGSYVLTITNPANGCTATVNATVTSNTTPPAGITAFSSDQLTCFTETVNITGNSGTPGVTYSWTGPNGFMANTRIAAVSAPGPYNLKVTNPANGCFGNAVANVMQNITKPDISVSNTGPLTRDIFEVEIQGSSATPDVDYSWTGPDGFASNSPVEFVFTPGDYILTVLDLNNGCSSADTTTVLQDLTGCQRVSSGAKSGITQPETAAAKIGLSTQLEYRTYPNPFTNRLNVEFKTPQNAQVNVGIYNAVGACSKVLFNGNAQGGQLYKLPLDATMLPAGVYYCVIRINEKVYTIKLIAIKK